MSGIISRAVFTARIAAAGTLCLSAAILQAQGTSASCPGTQRLEAIVGFESFDCDGCKLRRDPETGVAYVEFTKPPLVRGVGTSGALRDGDQLMQVDGSSVLTPFGAKKLATLRRGVEVQFTVRRNNVNMPVTLAPEYVCRGEPVAGPAWTYGDKVNFSNGTNNLAYRWTLPDSLAAWRPAWGIKPDTGIQVSYRRYFKELVIDSAFIKGAWAPSPKPSDLYLAWQPAQRDSGVFGSFNLESRYALLAPGGWVREQVQPLGYFGFSLGCDSCSYGSDPVAPRAAFSRLRFNTAPRIVTIDSSGPADRAGLRVGDVLTTIDGIAMASNAGGERFATVHPGDTVQLRFTRGGSSRTARLVLAERPLENSTASERGPDLLVKWIGQAGGAELNITGSNITVTEDPRTGERTITGSNMTILVKPPKPPGE